MLSRHVRAGAAFAVVLPLLLMIESARSTPAATLCTWGGTPTATSGVFTMEPGLSLTPAARPLAFYAEGPLSGGPGCTGKLVFDGVADTGSTCAFATFQGKVKGLRGVKHFRGAGNLVAPSVLFDASGDPVGLEVAQVVSGVGSGSEATDCATAAGFTEGRFSSVIVLFGARR